MVIKGMYFASNPITIQQYLSVNKKPIVRVDNRSFLSLLDKHRIAKTEETVTFINRMLIRC